MSVFLFHIFDGDESGCVGLGNCLFFFIKTFKNLRKRFFEMCEQSGTERVSFKNCMNVWVNDEW